MSGEGGVCCAEIPLSFRRIDFSFRRIVSFRREVPLQCDVSFRRVTSVFAERFQFTSECSQFSPRTRMQLRGPQCDVSFRRVSAHCSEKVHCESFSQGNISGRPATKDRHFWKHWGPEHFLAPLAPDVSVFLYSPLTRVKKKNKQ